MTRTTSTTRNRQTTQNPRSVTATITLEFDSNVTSEQLRRSPYYREILSSISPTNVRVDNVTISRSR